MLEVRGAMWKQAVDVNVKVTALLSHLEAEVGAMHHMTLLHDASYDPFGQEQGWERLIVLFCTSTCGFWVILCQDLEIVLLPCRTCYCVVLCSCIGIRSL